MANIELKKAQSKAELLAKRCAFIGAESYKIHTQNEAEGVIVFVRENGGGSVSVAAFSGRRAKPDFYYRYNGMQYAERAIKTWLEKIESSKQFKEKIKAENAAKIEQGHGLKVGDVLSSCWGYEQTRYDYYQVTNLVGKRSVEMREIGREIEETNYMQGLSVPVKNAFIGEAKTYRVTPDGSVKVSASGVYASKKESIKIGPCEVFKADCFTSYA